MPLPSRVLQYSKRVGSGKEEEEEEEVEVELNIRGGKSKGPWELALCF